MIEKFGNKNGGFYVLSNVNVNIFGGRIVQLLCLLVLSIQTSGVYAQTGPSDDFDGDGIINSIDIDDDNDGVLDYLESSCASVLTSSPINISSTIPNYTTPMDPAGLVNGVYTVNETRFSLNQGIEGHTMLEFTFAQPIVLDNIRLFVNNDTNAYVFYQSQAENNTDGTVQYKIQGFDGANWVDIDETHWEGIIQTDISGEHYMDVSFENYQEFSSYRFLGVTNGYNGAGSPTANRGTYFGSMTEIDFYGPTSCTDIDTDADALADRFDVDSDGDGCSDAFEAELTTDTTADFQFTAPYGTNGLVDTLETNTDSGSVTYTPTAYSSWALDVDEVACDREAEAAACAWSKYENMIVDGGIELEPSLFYEGDQGTSFATGTPISIFGGPNSGLRNLNSTNTGGLFDLLEGSDGNGEVGTRSLFDNSDSSVRGMVYDFGSDPLCDTTYEYSFDGRARFTGASGTYEIFVWNSTTNDINDKVVIETGNIDDLQASEDIPPYTTLAGSFALPIDNDTWRLVISITQGGSGNDHNWDRLAVRPVSSCGCGGTISGTLFFDEDDNGLLDTGESFLGGVTINLLDDNGDPVTDDNGDPITTVTDSGGNYIFTNIAGGTYRVQVDESTLPGGSDVEQSADPDETGRCVICDAITTTPIVLPDGDSASGIDFGYTGDSLPVTLSSFTSERDGTLLTVDWSTSSELFNVGFQLWGLDGSDQKWHKFHNWLIRSGSGNSVEPQSYSKRMRIPKSLKSLVAVGVSTVDNDGSEHYFGPFTVGKSYGGLSTLEPIAWDEVRASLDAQMAAKGYVKAGIRGYRKATIESSGLAVSAERVIEFSVPQDGLYRITSSQLTSAGIDLSEALKRDIALIDSAGRSVVRFIKSGRAFGDKGEIYFYGQAPSEDKRLYTSTSVYRLVLDRNRALNAQYQRKSGIDSGFSESYTAHSMVEDDKYYVLTSAADDPWLSRVVVSQQGQVNLHGTKVPVDADADFSQPLQLHLALGKSSDLAGESDEHVVQGLVLDSSGGLIYLDEKSSNNKGRWDATFEIPSDTSFHLDADNNALIGGAFSAGSGYSFSEIHIDGIGLSYARPYVARADEGYLEFGAPQSGELGYAVTVPDYGWPWVFATDGTNLVRIASEGAPRSRNSQGNRVRTVRFGALLGASTDTPLRYWAGSRSQGLAVSDLTERTLMSADSLLSQASNSNYLLVTHPAFMGDALTRYVDHKRGQGYRVAVINYLDILDVFGGSQPGPLGLDRYLEMVETRYGQLDHVLLVGGSTYDHTNRQDTGAMTFIPGHYGQSNYSAYTVSDMPYVTLDGGSVLFASIGRWPVRSMADLQVIVDKSILWASTDHSSGEALLIAEHTIDGEGLDFGSALDGVSESLPADFSQSRVYVDDILESNPGISEGAAIALAKGQIIDVLDSAPDLVLYNGHASTRQLSNKGLYKASDVDSSEAGGVQVWLPMACYVTYYESTHVNTLAHQLMFSGSAVNITGAVLLSNQSDNLAMGQGILNRSLTESQALGDAVRGTLEERNDAHTTRNWTLLGDPTITF